MNTVEICKNQLLYYGRAIEEAGLISSTWGNLSCRAGKDMAVITTIGISYNQLQSVDMAVVDLEGNEVECPLKPSTELHLHLEIYKARQDVQAIIHTHSKFATVFAVVRSEIAAVTEETAQLFGGCVPVAQYALPGSLELANNVVNALGDKGYAALLANHGVVCLGQTLSEAFQRCRIVERSAEILLWSNLLGGPCYLSENEIRTLRESFLSYYGQDMP